MTTTQATGHIICPVCGAENDTLSVTCIRCRGFLQGRVDALNLFETVWGLVESPRATFRRIVLARHKNYTILLSALSGIALVYAVAWLRHLGNTVDDPVMLGGMGLVLGPPAGIVALVIFTFVLRLALRWTGVRPGFRNLHAVAAYAGVPVIGSLLVVFPVELVVFGLSLFGSNPHPMVINPGAYIALIGLDILAAAWAVILLVEGVVIAAGARGRRTIAVALTVAGVAAASGAAVMLV